MGIGIRERRCGSCTVCCVVLPIDTPDLRKTSGVACASCLPDGGCGIHAKRPVVCHEFFCGWRMLPMLDEAWRPDRSGVLIVFDDDHIPAAYPERPGLKFILTAGIEPFCNGRTLGYLAALIGEGVPVFLAVPGPPGHHFAKAFVNRRLADASARRDGRALAQGVVSIYQMLAAGDFEPIIPSY